MSFEGSGLSDKLGNRYEGKRVAYHLLRLLNEDISSVTVEAIGDKEQGVDIIIEQKNGVEHFEQCKGSNGNHEHWRISDLNDKGILSNAFQHITQHHCEFHLTSPLPFKQLSDICISANNSNNTGSDLLPIPNQILKRQNYIIR